MKTRELLALLHQKGFILIRAQKHYILSNGQYNVCVPRHREVNIFLAKKIIRQAETGRQTKIA